MQERTKPTSPNLENMTQALQNLISLVLGLIAFLSAGGFIVVNSHLARYTDILAYNINPRQYLAAGVGLLIPPMLALAVVFLGYYTGRFLRFLSENRQARVPSGAPKNPLMRRVAPSIRFFDSLVNNTNARRLIFTVGIVLYTLLFGTFYGLYVYGSIPYYLGGGRPETMVLVFKDETTPRLLDLSTDAQFANRTGTLLMLAQLEDGWLVADTTTGRVVAVPNDVLSGIMDDTIQPAVITPTTAPTFTPTITATP
jgi:hypothetical protein